MNLDPTSSPQVRIGRQRPSRRSLLIDYSRHRADEASPERGYPIQLSIGSASSNAYRRGSVSSRASDGDSSDPKYYLESRSSAHERQPLNLFETKKKKEREPSLILEKRSGHRVSTVMEIDREDLGDLSDSDEEGNDHDDDDEDSIQFSSLKQDKKLRRDNNGSSIGTSFDDSDVYFALRRSFALPKRSATFDATKSSTQRLNESLMLNREEGEDEPTLGLRSQLALARAMHNSMSKLIVELEEEESAALQPERKPSPDRRAQLEGFGKAHNSMSNIINVAVADTVNWLVESATEPVQTLERASSLRDMLAKQRSFSASRRRLISGSKSSSNLAHMKGSKRRGMLRRSSSLRVDSNNNSATKQDQLRNFRKQRSSPRLIMNDDSSSGTVDHERRRGSVDTDESQPPREVTTGRQSLMTRAASSSDMVSGSPSGGRRNHFTTSARGRTRSSREMRDLSNSKEQQSSSNNMGIDSSSRSNLMDRSASRKNSSRSNVVETVPNRRNLMCRDSSIPNLMERPSSKRNLMSRESSRSNMMEKPSSRRNLMSRGSSRSNITEKPSSRRNLMSRSTSRSKLVDRSSSRRNLMSRSTGRSSSRRNLMSRSTSRSNLMEKSSSKRKLMQSSSRTSLVDLLQRRANALSLSKEIRSFHSKGRMSRGFSSSHQLGNAQAYHNLGNAMRNANWSSGDNNTQAETMTLGDNSHFVTGSRIRRL